VARGHRTSPKTYTNQPWNKAMRRLVVSALVPTGDDAGPLDGEHRQTATDVVERWN